MDTTVISSKKTPSYATCPYSQYLSVSSTVILVKMGTTLFPEHDEEDLLAGKVELRQGILTLFMEMTLVLDVTIKRDMNGIPMKEALRCVHTSATAMHIQFTFLLMRT